MADTDGQSKPDRVTDSMVKIVAMILVSGAIVAGGVYWYNSLELHPALKLTISTGINESDGTPTVTNVTFEQTKVIYKGVDSKVAFPDINVMVKNGSLLSEQVSYWASAPRKESRATSNITVNFREPYTPKNGDLLIITIRQTDSVGRILNKQTALYEWK